MSARRAILSMCCALSLLAACGAPTEEEQGLQLQQSQQAVKAAARGEDNGTSLSATGNGHTLSFTAELACQGR